VHLPRLRGELEQRLRAAVHELRPRLDEQGPAWGAHGMDPPADPVARLQHRDRMPALLQLAGGASPATPAPITR